MSLSDLEKVKYLANLISVAHADNRMSPNESSVIQSAMKRIGARKALEKKAITAVGDDFSPAPVGNFAFRVANFQDMVNVALADGALDGEEKPKLIDFARQIGLTNEQVKVILRECRDALISPNATRSCPSCSASAPIDASYCPGCGASLTVSDKDVAVNVDYKIPESGIAIEFAESSAGTFPKAVEVSQGATIYATCQRNNKTWYMAAWPADDMLSVLMLEQCLRSLKNKRVWLNGEESSWNDVFGFAWCAEQRGDAYRPVEHCFGVTDHRFNVWGCVQASMPWTEWANWFSYGSFKRSGMLKSKAVFVFDKERIRHEIETNLYKVRLCPHLNLKLADAVLTCLPDEVTVDPGGDWEYKTSPSESQGAIKIMGRSRGIGLGGMVEYYATGVTPRSQSVALGILKRALRLIGASDGEMRRLMDDIQS